MVCFGLFRLFSALLRISAFAQLIYFGTGGWEEKILSLASKECDFCCATTVEQRFSSK